MMESSAPRLLLSTLVLGSVRLPAATLGQIGKYFIYRFECLVADQSRGGLSRELSLWDVGNSQSCTCR